MSLKRSNSRKELKSSDSDELMTKIASFRQKTDIVLFVKDKPLLKFVNIQLLIPKTLN
jgi:hypothetical protein